MTWKPHIESCQLVIRTRLLRRLAGIEWGADSNILRKTYTGYVRPVLEYGITAWGTAARSNLQKVISVQNQNLRIITGGMKSTPIYIMECTDGSDEKAVANGGSKVSIEMPDQKTIESSIPTGTHCSNYIAELEAIKEALIILESITPSIPKARVVLLSDSRSVLEKLEDSKGKKDNTLLSV